MTEIDKTNFTKKDFLTATQAAKALNETDVELVEKTMKSMLLSRATIKIKNAHGAMAPRTAIYNFNGNGEAKRNANRLHPLALDLLRENINKKRGV
jgi:hypothetical protein